MKELISLIAKTKPEFLNKREQELRDLILGQTWDTEKDLAYILWPNDRHQMEYLRQTKDRLFKHVERTVYESKETSAYQGKYVECFK